ncbi:MAG: type II toxin-antitoxin system PemK/MazF family toxin [Dermatophilaceae bacterium]
MSNDGANATADRLGRGVVSVVPLTSTVTHVYRHSRLPSLTSTVTHVYPFQVMLPAAQTGLDLESKAQAEQVRPIDVEQLGARAGRLTMGLGLRLDEALRLHVGL